MVHTISHGRKFAAIAFASILFSAAAAPTFAQEAEENLDWLADETPSADTGADIGAEASAETGEAAAPPPAPASTGPKLDEIIVTAQKRAENVQDVPISVTAIGGETIKDNNISNLNDLSLYTPNVKL